MPHCVLCALGSVRLHAALIIATLIAVNRARYERWQDGLSEAYRWFLGDWTFHLLFPQEGVPELSHWHGDKGREAHTLQNACRFNTRLRLLHLLRLQRVRVNSCRIKTLLETVADQRWWLFRIQQGVTDFPFIERRNEMTLYMFILSVSFFSTQALCDLLSAGKPHCTAFKSSSWTEVGSALTTSKHHLWT